MRISRPSPALVVSIIALVVACAGTAAAAGVLISNSGQVRASSLNGTDLKAKSLTNRNLGDGAVNARVIKKGSVTTEALASGVKSALTSQGFTATESIRRDGPSAPNAGMAKVVTLTGLAAGTYTLLAKTTMTPLDTAAGLGELLKDPKTGNAHCTLDAAGDADDARAPIATPYSLFANTLNLQLTRTLAATSDITLTCDANIKWKASNASIIALKLAGSTRQDSTG